MSAKTSIELRADLSKLERLPQNSRVINDDSESIVHNDWLEEWSELKHVKRTKKD